MQTGLALRDESDPRPSFICIGDEPTQHSRSAHLGLLRAFPPVRVAQHELDVVCDGAPERVTVRVRVDNEGVRAAEEVGEEVAEDLHGGLPAWEGREAHPVHLELHRLRTEKQFEPVL